MPSRIHTASNIHFKTLHGSSVPLLHILHGKYQTRYLQAYIAFLLEKTSLGFVKFSTAIVRPDPIFIASSHEVGRQFLVRVVLSFQKPRVRVCQIVEIFLVMIHTLCWFRVDQFSRIYSRVFSSYLYNCPIRLVTSRLHTIRDSMDFFSEHVLSPMLATLRF